MRKLVQGIVDFRKGRRPDYAETFARLALRQKADALYISCSDSRVQANVFASTEPGDLFVVRNPGNLVSPAGPDGRSVADESEAAAIEFGLDVLEVRDIIVCGHSGCGVMPLPNIGPEMVRGPTFAPGCGTADPPWEGRRRGEGNKEPRPQNGPPRLTL